MKLRNKTILIISNEPWGDIWYSKHNWAFELSNLNEVFFIDPPLRWNFLDFFKTNIRIETYTNNLKIFRYNNRIPFTRFNVFFTLNELFIYKALNKFLSDKKDVIFWTFDPYRLINPRKLKVEKAIHFITDKYRIKREFILTKNVDYHFTISQVLSDRLNIGNPLVLSHGISETEFSIDTLIADSYILYIGNIDQRLDYKVIESLIKSFPEEKFLFIGKRINVDNEFLFKKKYLNFVCHEPVHFKKLKNYIAQAKVCLAPMKLDVRGNNINHHKLLQYLAFGKPVLAAKFSDYSDNKLLIEYETINDAIVKLRYLLKNPEPPEILKNRIAYAKKHTYRSLINKIENFI